MKIHPGRNDDRELVVRFKAPNRNAGIFVLEEMVQRIPVGYVWERESIGRSRKPGRSSDGARVGVTLVILHNDPDKPALADDEVVELFGDLVPK